MEHASFAPPEMLSIDKLSKWDGEDNPLAPLNSTQKDSFLELAAIASNRSMPIEVICFAASLVLVKVYLKTVKSDNTL